MPKIVNVAAVQMDARLVPTVECLARSESLVTEASAAGAQLIVLPEFFNAG